MSLIEPRDFLQEAKEELASLLAANPPETKSATSLPIWSVQNEVVRVTVEALDPEPEKQLLARGVLEGVARGLASGKLWAL